MACSSSQVLITVIQPEPTAQVAAQVPVSQPFEAPQALSEQLGVQVPTVGEVLVLPQLLVWVNDWPEQAVVESGDQVVSEQT